MALALIAIAAPAKAGSPPCGGPPEDLAGALHQSAAAFDGKVGIAVRRVDCPWLVGQRSDEYFPQQSVSKLWVAITALDAVDRQRAKLDEQLLLTRADLSVFNQTIRYTILEKGRITLTLRQLLHHSLSESDNISNSRILRHVGGPRAVRSHLAALDLRGIRFGPGETAMQSAIAGLAWQPAYSMGRAFEHARARLPMAKRQAALRAYLDNPVDGATPAAITRALSRLAQGRLLSTTSTAILLEIMRLSRSGPRRLKGGTPQSWTIYHKTGTGQTLAGLDTGYNDVGILEAPDGTRYAVAVMIGETRQPIAVRMSLMQAVARSVVEYHNRRARARPGRTRQTG